jgi:hypothetical protein
MRQILCMDSWDFVKPWEENFTCQGKTFFWE